MLFPMKCLRPIFYCAVFMLAAAGLSGCFPGNDNHQGEERDPHYQRGLDLDTSQDYKAAAEEFEKALDTNPRSAAAHYQLGLICDDKIPDYAAAIYHYERLLRLDPGFPRAPWVRERIRGCKEALVKTEFPLPNSQNLQSQIFALTEENRLLKQQLEDARNHPAANPPSSTASTAHPASPAASNSLPASNPALNPLLTRATTNTVAGAIVPASGTVESSAVSRIPTAATEGTRPRTYVVQPKDSIYSVAARFGLKASAVLAANPNVSPTHLRVGQNLVLP
jgi:tetratricopeptide (TPR) repeat protein